MDQQYISREELKRAVHNVHDFIRNQGAGYGTDALKIFNFFYALMRISSNEKSFKELGLTEEFRFDKLFKLDEVHLKERVDKLLDLMLDHRNDKFKKVRKLIWSDLPIASVDKYFYYKLIRKIKKISEIEGDLSHQCRLNGKVYEYFIGRDKSAISNLGAYFTDRYIIDYIYDKFTFELDDGFIPTFVDPFGGSGGFTIAYIQKMNELFPDLDWQKNLERVHHFDMAETVVKNCAVEVMTLTGEVPEYGKNFNVQNSFSTLYKGKKFKLVFTNFPYGGDKSKASQEKEDRKGITTELKKLLKETKDNTLMERINEQIKQIDKENKVEEKEQKDQQVNFNTVSSEIRDYVNDYNSKIPSTLSKKEKEKEKMDPNDKEECGMILMNMLLAENGTACGVIKQGCFFDKKYRAIRKDLVENYNVESVIRIPADAFENTTTATSILIYHNTPEKTSQVKFYDMIVEKYTENKYEFNLDGEGDVVKLVQRKGDLLPIADKLVAVASVEQLRENNYTFDAKKYNPIQIIPNEGWEMKELRDYCENETYKKLNKDINGKYNFYTCSFNIQKCLKSNLEGEYLIIGTRGTICMNYNEKEKFGCGTSIVLLKSKEKVLKYLYFLYKSWDYLNILVNKTTIPMITKEQILGQKVPFPTNPSKIQEWTDKISEPFDEMNSKREEILKLEKQVQEEIKRIIEEEDCEEKELGEICEVKAGVKFSMSNNYRDSGNYGYIRIQNLQDKNSKMIYLDNSVYNTLHSYLVNKDDILISDVSEDIYCKIVPKEWNKFVIYGSVIRIFNIKEVNKYYLKAFLQSTHFKSIKNKNANGTIQKHLTLNIIRSAKIPIPTNPKVLSALNLIFNKIEQLNEEVDNAEKLYQQYLQELHNDAIKEIIMPEVKEEEVETQSIQEEETDEQVQKEQPKEETLSEESSSEEEEEPQPKKKVVIKKLVKKVVPRKKVVKK